MCSCCLIAVRCIEPPFRPSLNSDIDTTYFEDRNLLDLSALLHDDEIVFDELGNGSNNGNNGNNGNGSNNGNNGNNGNNNGNNSNNGTNGNNNNSNNNSNNSNNRERQQRQQQQQKPSQLRSTTMSMNIPRMHTFNHHTTVFSATTNTESAHPSTTTTPPQLQQRQQLPQQASTSATSSSTTTTTTNSLFSTQRHHDPMKALMSTAPVGLFRHLSDTGGVNTAANKVLKKMTSTSEQQLRRLEESSFQQQEVLLKGELKGEPKGEPKGGDGDGKGSEGGGGPLKKRSSTPTLFHQKRGNRAQSESFDFVNVSQLGEMNRKQLEAMGLTMEKEKPRERSGSISSGGSSHLLRERSGSGSSGGSGLARRKSLE